MKPQKRFLVAPLFATLLALAPTTYSAVTPAEKVQWHGVDIAGNALAIPVSDRPTLVLFVRPGQPQSQEAITQVQSVLKKSSPQVLLVVSGQQATEQAKALSVADGTPGPVFADTEFALSGDLGVHVWPEIVILDSTGKCVARLPGLRQSGPTEICAYLDLAQEKITQAELDNRLTVRQVVGDEQAAARHLQVARQMLAGGRIEQASAELALAMTKLPDDGPTQLLAVRVLLALQRNDEAMTLLERIPNASIPTPQRHLVRARALIQLERWTDAAPLVQEAVKLSPDPAEAQYLLGVTLQHDGKWTEAAAAFRAAAEAALPAEARIAAPSP